jgi:hypothetical protein
MLTATNMTFAKPQISKFQAHKFFQVGFNGYGGFHERLLSESSRL